MLYGDWTSGPTAVRNRRSGGVDEVANAIDHEVCTKFRQHQLSGIFVTRKVKMPKPPPKAPAVTNRQLQHIAGEGLARPSALKAKEVQKLAAAVMDRIPRKGS